MAIDEKQKAKLEEMIEKLEKVRGRHTELITVYISAGFNINVVAKQLESEKSTAKNIKSKATQKAVLESLDTIIRELKLYKKTPENGMAIFAGNFADKEGQEDIQSFVLEPPKPLNTRLYRCDQTFVLEPLRELLEVEEVYGLVVMDRKEATFGLLEGKQIKVLRKLTSGVPGKVRAGGQCLSPDTLIMKSDGDLVRLDEGHNPMIILSENFNKEEVEDTPILAKWENEKDLFRITTCYPKFEIKSSKDHTFFIRNEKGIEEKSLCEIKEGDYLIMPEKINLYLEDQEINFVPKIKQEFNMKKVNIPEKINPDFAKILGYYLGDGSWEVDRLTFFEQRKEVADFYKNLLEETFGIEVKYLFRKSKNYHQLRIYSRIISQLFRRLFSEINKTLNDKIPGIILKSSDKSLAAFISGFFDAEGYVNEGRVALGINNKFLTRQLQFSLLRLGIISSINEYDNRKNPYSNNIRYTLAIDDIGSLKRFQEKVNFCSEEKKEKLNRIFGLRSNRNKVRQLIVNGREVAKILRNSGLNTRQFNCPLFFVNKRQMSKEIFKESILSKIEDEELKRRLELFYNSNLIAVKIAKIEKLNQEKTIDIETKNHNFLANGLIVHNSSQRIHRLTEGLAKEFFRRIAEHMKEIFFEMPRLKGILLGGPMPTKEDFLEEGNLVTALKEKVLGCVDLGYADEHGLDLLVEGSQEILASQEIIYEKKLLEDFFDKLGKEPKKTMYKEADVEKGLKYGAVQKLLISKKFDKKKADELTVKAESISAEVELISTETEEGMQFWNLGGVGAILRFEV